MWKERTGEDGIVAEGSGLTAHAASQFWDSSRTSIDVVKKDVRECGVWVVYLLWRILGGGAVSEESPVWPGLVSSSSSSSSSSVPSCPSEQRATSTNEREGKGKPSNTDAISAALDTCLGPMSQRASDAFLITVFLYPSARRRRSARRTDRRWWTRWLAAAAVVGRVGCERGGRRLGFPCACMNDVVLGSKKEAQAGFELCEFRGRGPDNRALDTAVNRHGSDVIHSSSHPPPTRAQALISNSDHFHPPSPFAIFHSQSQAAPSRGTVPLQRQPLLFLVVVVQAATFQRTRLQFLGAHRRAHRPIPNHH
jgi:hypothetical protein